MGGTAGPIPKQIGGRESENSHTAHKSRGQYWIVSLAVSSKHLLDVNAIGVICRQQEVRVSG